MCDNEQKPEIEPRKEEIRSRIRSCVIFTTISQSWNNPHGSLL